MEDGYHGYPLFIFFFLIVGYPSFSTRHKLKFQISPNFFFLHAVENFFNKKADQKLKRLHVKIHLNQEPRNVGITARAVRDNDSNRTGSARKSEKGNNRTLYSLLYCVLNNKIPCFSLTQVQ